ncbi:Ankyrin repeat domain-containing protein [Plasmodiophora brassicae]
MHMDAAVLLCQAGADVEARSRIGSTALHRAASEGHANVVAFLAEQMGASVHAVNKIGNTALHAAVCARQPAAAAELIRAMRGDGIHARNNIGMRAVDYADGCRDLQTLFDGP